MKKHIFAFICVFVILFNTLSFKEAHAMDIGVAIDIGSDILYQGWDMINSILNGAIISFSPYSQYADKAAAMGAFYNDWGNILEKLTGGTIDQDPAITFSDTTYPLDYGMSYDTMNYFVDEYGRIVAQSPSDPYYFPMLISPETYAEWNRYQNSFIGKYINLFQPEVPQTYPDPFYSAYLNRINLRDSNDNTAFWFYNFPLNSANGYTLATYPAYHYSWVCAGGDTFPENVGSLLSPRVVPFDPITLYVTSNNGLYSYSFTGDTIPKFIQSGNMYYVYGTFNGTNNYLNGAGRMYADPPSTTYNISLSDKTLSEVLYDISLHFKNVNIYVDDVLWSYVGDVADPPVLAPDVIRLGQDGPVIKNDVFVPEQDLYVDLIGWTNLVDDNILDGGTIGFDDLIDSGVITDAEGNIITDENRDEYFKKRDIASVITDELVDADLDNLLPPAPSPPDDDPSNWHFPSIVIPEGGDPDPKSTGLSVLARIINVTNQSMPAEVITMFWGICITMLILGIIKILHK